MEYQLTHFWLGGDTGGYVPGFRPPDHEKQTPHYFSWAVIAIILKARGLSETQYDGAAGHDYIDIGAQEEMLAFKIHKVLTPDGFKHASVDYVLPAPKSSVYVPQGRYEYPKHATLTGSYGFYDLHIEYTVNKPHVAAGLQLVSLYLHRNGEIIEVLDSHDRGRVAIYETDDKALSASLDVQTENVKV